MITPESPVVIRGGGDLATGVAWRLWRSGIPVVVCELAHPLTIRRTVALSTAVTAGSADIEGMVGRLVTLDGIAATLAMTVAATVAAGEIPVLVSPELPGIEARAVVDARLAKRNIDTTTGDAPLVIGLGPGFTAGVDCHAVIETERGHHLGRVLWQGSAVPNSGTPGEIGGRGAERVVRAPVAGVVRWEVSIGDIVDPGCRLGRVGHAPILAPFRGVVRGLIIDGTEATRALKIADIDPRVTTNCQEISDKALAIGGGVLEALLSWEAGRRG